MAMSTTDTSMVQISSKQDAVVAEGMLSFKLLSAEDDVTSNTVMKCFASIGAFNEQSAKVTKEIQQRDQDDADKLQTGVDADVELGVLPKLDAPTYMQIDVLGKSADEVAGIMLEKCGTAVDTGCVIVLVGLSGTGKGTTVKKIRSKVKNSLTWSNGNVFRSLTLLAAAKAESLGVEMKDFVAEKKNLVALMKSLTFEDHGTVDGKEIGFDTKIHNEELKIGPLYVNQVKNTILKGPSVATNIPTVAGQSQGMVVQYVDKAVAKLQEAGFVVLVEGREATVNYVKSPYRFCLSLQDPTIIGKRRMVQRMVGAALKNLSEDSTSKECMEALSAALSSFATTAAQ